LFGQ
jgi:transcriptional regulator with XRE-family HTH domain